ncbi:tripeptidyl peptidase A [Vararia minispora EC-137]|uniref:Tripeptidyl peptidase A n=1 Tax=Vararia minispora EC-137 TaxID=1314806 RepID=A0ACB8QW48_9AGAM|nr:tripeptidyl peptidase A [Vararia minispora EC-137]
MIALSLLVASLAGLSSAAASTHRLKERVAEPRNWIRLSAAPADQIIPLRIALPQLRFDELERQLYEVSDPDHPRYGQHLSKAEVETLVAPHPDSLGVVNAWLASHGLEEDDLERTPAQDWVTVRVPVALAEEMLATKYHAWQHADGGDVILRTTSYSLPAHVHDHVELVHPTTFFGHTRALRTTFRFSEVQDPPVPVSSEKILIPGSGITVDPSCNTTITVTCLKELYNAIGFQASAHNGNQIAVTGYLEQFANIQDLQTFYSQQRPDALNSSFKTVLINGGLNNQSAAEAGAEANLDTQFAFGLTFPTPATFFSTGGRPPFIPDIGTPTKSDTNEPYTKFLDFILAQNNIPQVISTSYGDDEQTVPIAFARRVCAGFAQLGARGTSLTFSSGDGGVGDGDPNPATQTCLTNDGRNATRFITGFPATCPFVTAVGATINVPEIAVDFSGGGFSDFFARPAYQHAAVTRFLDGLAPGTFAGLFNASGRAIPDVSAEGDKFGIIIGGQSFHIGGTSASSPTFAGFVSLLNSARLSAGKRPLGFLNPLLYSANVAATFNDITVGNNPGCGTEGFNATVGWDAITGLGTPDFGKLLSIVG